MNLSKPQAMLWRSRSDDQSDEQSGEHSFHVEPSVETVLELGEVAVRVLGEVKGVVGAVDGVLKVAKQRVDGSKLGQLDAIPPAPDDERLMGGADDGRSAEAPQAVRNDGGRGGKVLGSEHGNLRAAMGLLTQASDDRLA